MRLLFILHDKSYFRNFIDSLRILAKKDHHIIIGLPEKIKGGGPVDQKLPGRLAKFNNVKIVTIPKRTDKWSKIANHTRSGRDLLRYHDERYSKANRLTRRAIDNTNKKFEAFYSHPFIKRNWKLFDKLMALHETGLPSDPNIDQFIKDLNIDAVIVTPLIFPVTRYQTDYVKSAHKLGIPVATPVFSWDNLSNKGTFKIKPDQIFIWNEVQLKEATHLHGFPKKRITITGGARFDWFLNYKTDESRESTFKRLHLNSEMPLITYLCSSTFIAPEEEAFLKKWINAVRSSSDPKLANANIIVRPYPNRDYDWDLITDSDERNFLIVDNQNNVEAIQDSVVYADAVIGINTTAMLEAGALNKPIFSVTDDLTKDGQTGTVHFDYLVNACGGLVTVAKDMNEHIQHLTNCISDNSKYLEKNKRFNELFLRPLGLNKKVAPIIAEEFSKLDSYPKRKSIFGGITAAIVHLLLRLYYKI